MAPGKRRPLHPNSGSNSPLGGSFRANRLNFRPTTTQEDRRGTKPTASPSSVGLIFVAMLLHICKKSLLFDPRLKIVVYCGAIFMISLVADYVSMPKTYFSRSDNMLNQYFVKWGWAWLLAVTVPWVALTGHMLGCGRRPILIKHLCRLIIATMAWMLWIKFFNYIETNHGRCINTKDFQLQSKTKCLQAGKFWSGFDISGHTFILIYSSLILAEEGAAVIGWEGIKDLILKEEHSRNVLNETSTGHLRNLSSEDLEFLKKSHNALTPYLRALFVAMTLQQLLWDVMLVSTLMYYHIMLEKMIGGVIAILTWFVTYRWWFKLTHGGILSPGEGLFKYTNGKDIGSSRARRNTLNGSGPRFMGMPIRIPQENPEPVTNFQRLGDSEISASRI